MSDAKTVRRGRRATDAVAVVAEIDRNALAAIIAAGEAGMFTPEAVHSPLVAAGLVEINAEFRNEAGEIATRATQKGIEFMTVAQETKAPRVAPSFQIEDAVPMPTVAGRGSRTPVYPFDQLEVGQSFFVANDEDRPNAAKSLASTVSSATARYSVPSEDGATKTNRKGAEVPVMVETRKFIVRAVDETAQGRGPGARVWRVK